MKRFLLILISFTFSCGGCEKETLTRACQNQGDPCIIKDGTVHFGNVDEFIEGTSCVPGYLECAEGGGFICENFIGPSEELCDQVDNDCDGSVDEDFDLDRDGFTSCSGDCNDDDPDIRPDALESCDNIDNNCDGDIDNFTRECWTGSSDTVIDTATTSCRSGTQRCLEGRWSYCGGQVYPRQEQCDGLDNDCDGEIDEETLSACGPRRDEGICRRGDLICSPTGDQICINAVFASVAGEVCNNVDDDCDGMVDEELVQPCQTACGVGEELCNEGAWVGCTAPIPQEEVCDGIDNNCDGTVDEDCECEHGTVSPCKGGVLINPVDNSTISCGLGVTVCDQGEWGACIYVADDLEVCNNWDDDCDGVIDEIVAPCGDPNTVGIGECIAGTSTCSAGQWGLCDGEVVPVTEICDGLDNDCDGETDEELDPHDKVDILFLIDGSGSMCSVVDALRLGISNYVSDFQGEDYKFGIAMVPGSNGDSAQIITSPSLTDIASFQTALQGVTCNLPATEPTYDAAWDASRSIDTLGVGWRSDAHPYIILVTDEPAQTIVGYSETSIALNMINCVIGGCTAGDRVEFYVITQGAYASQWDEPTFFEPGRIVEIFPADGDRYTDLLRNIFSNVCI